MIKTAQQLISFQGPDWKVFHGGPIQSNPGVQWMSPVIFDDGHDKIRAVYEISFVNCLPNPDDAKDAQLFFLDISDIDMKFRNQLSEEYSMFSRIVNNDQSRCVLVRKCDVSNVYYPEIFVAPVFAEFRDSDKEYIASYLNTAFRTQIQFQELSPPPAPLKSFPHDFEGVIGQKEVVTEIKKQKYSFLIDHVYLPNDPWKSYYVVTHKTSSPSLLGRVTLRLDSGCTSGQNYQDSSCLCFQELIEGLEELSRSENTNSLLIHIPTQTGRGFGSALQGETEIYKRGGKGRIHETVALSDIEAARLLYQTRDIDIRTYDGCAQILKLRKISSVHLLTRNQNKIKGLTNNGILAQPL